ncbi:hypothetical protein Sango_2816700 [Sesamum angolense]|uniref:Reverse transcriptase n=1 Tax=Sesamum angolense TaxID=2727404 RepID=A0AAE1T6X9_9LAMI|nr:hypothetical protein Sango_2816700 [Sesamum angolense]
MGPEFSSELAGLVSSPPKLALLPTLGVFGGSDVVPLRTNDLPTSLGDDPHRKIGREMENVYDFIDLNKACPKDPYPLPQIDRFVDSTASCVLLSMMDACQGYHQIFMVEEDQESVLLSSYAFRSQERMGHIPNTGYDMKLNLAKCTSRVKRGKFMGYLVMERGIEVNLKKLQAITELKSLRSIREI